MATIGHAKYVVDSKGKKTAVILPVKEYESMLQELEDLRDAQLVDELESSAEGFISLEELRKEFPRKAS